MTTRRAWAILRSDRNGQNGASPGSGQEGAQSRIGRTMTAQDNWISSGLAPLDALVQGLRPGDNVVWQVDSIEDYRVFARPFIERAVRDGRTCVYVRFAPHPPVLSGCEGVQTVVLDPSPGFDFFSGELNRLLARKGRGVFYVFDNLSALVAEWATDELLSSFFQLTCPYLYELDTITYFPLLRGQQAHATVARIRDTTQLLLDVFHVQQRLYVHPIKVDGRYSPQMFLPHVAAGDVWEPVFASGDAADVSAATRRRLPTWSPDSAAPWETVYRKLLQYRSLDPEVYQFPPETLALKRELIRMLFGPDAELNRLAERHFGIGDLLNIRERMIGSGCIGGKAVGMLLARAVLGAGAAPFRQHLEPHDSFYIGGDVFYSFLVTNNLFRLRLQTGDGDDVSPEAFATIEARFLAGHFPPEIEAQFRETLDYFGQAPVVVRSSSLQEDRFGRSFAGKYRTEVVVNQGSLEQRLAAFQRAVKLVYASALNPEVIGYRRKHGLSAADEQMAVLVQRASGVQCGDRFAPWVSGAAYSRNFYPWNEAVDPAQGVLRLLAGLGTRAGAAGESACVVPISHPELACAGRLEANDGRQRALDLLDLAANRVVTRTLADVAREGSFPHLARLVSVVRAGEFADLGPGDDPAAAASALVLTFRPLLREPELVRVMGAMLTRLEAVFKHPVDIEFTISPDPRHGFRLNLLQCRPVHVLTRRAVQLALPAELPPERVLFRADRVTTGGTAVPVRFLIVVDPAAWADARHAALRRPVAELLGRLCHHPEIVAGNALLVAPGPWAGAETTGVPVVYADVEALAGLVELLPAEPGYQPERCFGPRHLQELADDEVICLSALAGAPGFATLAARAAESANRLADLVPEAAALAPVLRVLDVAAIAPGTVARLVADPYRQEAVCYLETADGT